MAIRESAAPITLGFLTVVNDPEQGLFGGYLALNAAGRPLEFHCTAPVKANRAQEILYGPTLACYLQGELIGGALLSRVKSTPRLVCTDCVPALAVRSLAEFPVALVLPSQEHHGAMLDALFDGETGARLIHFKVGANRLAVAATHESDRRTIEQTCGDLLAAQDLAEPFSRIHEALQEARSAAAPKTARQNAAA